MTTKRTRMILPAIGVAALTVLLTGCSGADAGAQPTTTPPATATTAASTPTRTPTATPTAGHSTAAAPTTATRGSTSSSAQGGSSSGGSSTTGRCATSQLSGSVADGGPATAGAQPVAIILHNTSTATCTLQGWPGISFVGGGNGTQIGTAATLDRSTPHTTQTLRPGGEVQAIVTVAHAGNWDSATCEPRVIDGFRVIPPGSRQALFVGASGSTFEACASTGVHQLRTSALASF
ncbi:DUF4232 domain-containing protein [Curtobacterium sp. VKM Ac-2922]|uniref:DUF4232 domain-containing protein n=1 Tax=Curtobacterium sp. VKM Ac-2922 TaxID=2929475 RepID=UPI001FB2ADA0|nr:DUF4232 domain-containing protein [Curtobacterium sp. VKM Ac-2922]MCJ1714976.1 DUF4232 domain-containing protein [Curtobacterium sp. VKM Ac-2922]